MGCSYTWGITKTFDTLKDSTSNCAHGEGTSTIVYNPPWAVSKRKKIKNCTEKNVEKADIMQSKLWDETWQYLGMFIKPEEIWSFQFHTK